MPQAMSTPYHVVSEREIAKEAGELKKISQWLDSKYQLPFGFRIGWDGILGLIPGFGDMATNIISFYILYKAALLGCPLSVISRMGLNLLVDNVLDTLPLIGNIFDFAWKANNKNLALLERFLQQPHQTTRSSQMIVMLTLFMIALALIAVGVLTFYLAGWLWGFFQTAF